MVTNTKEEDNIMASPFTFCIIILLINV